MLIIIYINVNCIGTEDSLVFLLAENKFLPILKTTVYFILSSSESGVKSDLTLSFHPTDGAGTKIQTTL